MTGAARTAGAGDPHPHVYLGVMANQDGASGDKHITYPQAGQSMVPEDDPRRAFERLFGSGGVGPGSAPADPKQASDRLVDALVAWGDVEAIRARVQAHLDAGANHVCVQALRADTTLPLREWETLAELI